MRMVGKLNLFHGNLEYQLKLYFVHAYQTMLCNVRPLFRFTLFLHSVRFLLEALLLPLMGDPQRQRARNRNIGGHIRPYTARRFLGCKTLF